MSPEQAEQMNKQTLEEVRQLARDTYMQGYEQAIEHIEQLLKCPSGVAAVKLLRANVVTARAASAAIRKAQGEPA